MTIIEPAVELIPYDGDVVSHVARCARICYDKETGNSDEKLYDNLIKNKHWSVFRHVTYYAIVHINNYRRLYSVFTDIDILNLNILGITAERDSNYWYIVYNGNFALDYPWYHNYLKDYLVSPEEFENTEMGYKMIRYTFKITTQISTSRELNRVSPNNITEMSTRYVDLVHGSVVRPHWLSKEYVDTFNSFGLWDKEKYKNLPDHIHYYFSGVEHGFDMYQRAIKAGMKREDARGVLPLDTATKVIYTYSVNEWKHIIELRSSKRAHSNAAIIANMVKSELEELGY